MKKLQAKLENGALADTDVIEICNAINRLPGLETRLSCSGHDTGPLWVIFVATDAECVRPMLNAIDCLEESPKWRVEMLSYRAGYRVNGQPARFRFKVVCEMEPYSQVTAIAGAWRLAKILSSR